MQIRGEGGGGIPNLSQSFIQARLVPFPVTVLTVYLKASSPEMMPAIPIINLPEPVSSVLQTSL